MNNKEIHNLNYTKKELQLLYWQAKARDIKKKELKDIKKALYEIVNLGQHSSDFLLLLKVLKYIPEKSLKSIENGTFTNFYQKLANKEKNEYGPFYKGDYYHCIKLLILLYTDYSNISSIEEFNYISKAFIELIYIDNNEELTNIIFNINPHLSYIIEDYKRYKELKQIKNNNIFDNTYIKIEDLYHNLQVTLLMNIELFNYQYQLPTDIISFLYDNYESTKYILNQYDNCKDKYQFSKLIINEYLTHINKTNNLSNIPNQKLKKLIQK